MRKSFLLSIVLVAFISAICAEKALAGAWTVPKYKVWGEYYMKWDYAKEQFLANGKRGPINTTDEARTWEFIQEPKLEFGVTDWLTALGSVEYKESHYKEYNRPDYFGTGDRAFARKNNGVTNIKLGGRWRFMQNPFVFSTQVKAFIYPGYGNYHGDDPAFTNQPSIGRGDDAVEWRMLIGKTFDVNFTKNFKLPFYVGAETGYRWRTRSVCNDIPYFIEGGFWPREWLLLKSELDGYKCHAGTGSIKESYGVWRIGGIWQVFGGDSILRTGNKLFNLEFDYGMTVWGKNTTAFQEWTFKIDTQF